MTTGGGATGVSRPVLWLPGGDARRSIGRASYRPAAAVSATSVIWHAFSMSSTCKSRSFSLWTPRIMVRTEPRKVSGGGSKLVSSTSTTSPISSTSRLPAPSSERHHVPGKHACRPGLQFKPPPQIDRRDDLAAQVDEATDHGRGRRNPRDIKRADDFLHAFQAACPDKTCRTVKCGP